MARSTVGSAVGGAVVFDCDGLLLDTESCWSRGEKALFDAYRVEFTPEHDRQLLGASGEDAGRMLARVLDQPGREDALVEELISLCWDEVTTKAEPMPGARDLVKELHGRAPIGVASNSPRAMVEAALQRVGFDGAFGVVLGADDVTRPKPDPEIYLTVCERLGAAPEESVALEDSLTGVAAARAAGMYVIGVPSHPGVELDADEVVESLAHPSVRAAITR